MSRTNGRCWWLCEAVAVGIDKRGIAHDVDVAAREPGRANIKRQKLRAYLDDSATYTCAVQGLEFVGYLSEPTYYGEWEEGDVYL